MWLKPALLSDCEPASLALDVTYWSWAIHCGSGSALACSCSRIFLAAFLAAFPPWLWAIELPVRARAMISRFFTPGW